MNIKRITSIGLTMLTICALASCGKPSDDTTSVEPGEEVSFTLKVKYVDGTKLADYDVSVTDTAGKEVSKGKTDRYGMYTWKALDNDVYTATLPGLAKGYKVEDSLVFDKNTTYIAATVTSGVIKEDIPYETIYHTPGQLAYDFTLTDYKDKSKTYTFSKLLKEKSFIMINFFYIGCSPCQAEFPAIEKAYQKYQDKMEIIAIDVYNNQTATQLDTYRTKTLGGISFPMCFEKTNTLAIAFNVAYVPTTAIIDRYGRIDLWTYGTDTSQASWERKFAKYSDPDYVPGEPQWDTPDWTDKDILGH